MISNRKEHCYKTCEGTGGFKKIEDPYYNGSSLKNREVMNSPGSAQGAAAEDPAVAARCPDWALLAEQTGSRPAVQSAGLTRYSLAERTRHTQHVMNTHQLHSESNLINHYANEVIKNAISTVDTKQNKTNKLLKETARNIFRWKTEFRTASKAMKTEVDKLDLDRQRLIAVLKALLLPEGITKECIELRLRRTGKDLTFDAVEHYLIQERNLINEVRAKLNKTLKLVKEQMSLNKVAKQKLDYEYCEKETAHTVETQNLSLNSNSNTIMFVPGSAKYGENTTSVDNWEYFCKENIVNCEMVRQNSVDLRATIHPLIVEVSKKLRTQADITDSSLSENIGVTIELCSKLEQNLLKTLRKIAVVERSIEKTGETIMKLDSAMKCAQSRLDGRARGRPRGEALRDAAHDALLNEVRTTHAEVTALRANITRATATRTALYNTSTTLQQEIATKRNSLIIDRDRCAKIRTHFPSALDIISGSQ